MRPRTVRLFLSWCHDDKRLKDAFTKALMTQLSIVRGVTFEWFEDSHIAIGEEWRKTILARIGEADYSVQLISPAFLASKFIADYEIPPFLDPSETKGVLPVSLVHVPLTDPNIDWRGIEAKQVYSLDGKPFQQLAGRRPQFVTEVASQIVNRVLGPEHWRTL